MPGDQNVNSKCPALWLSVTIMPGNPNVDSKCPTLWLSVTIIPGDQNVSSKYPALQILVTVTTALSEHFYLFSILFHFIMWWFYLTSLCGGFI